MRIRITTAATLLALVAPTLAKADITTDTVRQKAEQACYDDANKFCNDAIPDETKITACMNVHRKQLSPRCRQMFDAGAK